MSIPDELMHSWFTLLTDRGTDEIRTLTDPGCTQPMEAKKMLAADIVTFYHGPAVAASHAAGVGTRLTPGAQDPKEIPEAPLEASLLTDGKMGIAKLVHKMGLAPSGNDSRRKVEQGGVTIGPDREKITDPHFLVAVTEGLIVRVGGGQQTRTAASISSSEEEMSSVLPNWPDRLALGCKLGARRGPRLVQQPTRRLQAQVERFFAHAGRG